MNSTQIKNFQGLRTVAFLLVFLSHISFGYNANGTNLTNYLGGAGVSLFIILSGFLLGIQHQTPINNRISYYFRKIKHFYPLHVFTLLLSLPLCYTSFVNNGFRQVLALFFNLLLVHSFVPSSTIYFSFNSVSWYLSITLFFVVLSPFIVKLFIKFNEKICRVLVSFILVFDLAYSLLLMNTSLSHWLIYICPLFRFLEFITGVCLFKIFCNINTRKHQGTIFVILGFIMQIIAFCGSIVFDNKLFATVVWIIPSALIVVGLYISSKQKSIINPIFSNKVIVRIGGISFELFMIHQLTIRYFNLFPNSEEGWHRMIFSICSLMVSGLFAFIWNWAFKRISVIREKKKKEEMV